MQAPLDVVHNLVLAAHFTHWILCELVPFLCRKITLTFLGHELRKHVVCQTWPYRPYVRFRFAHSFPRLYEFVVPQLLVHRYSRHVRYHADVHVA
jgi:hypothetical protein